MNGLYAIDFEYDGVKLSDFGFMLCEFDGEDDVYEKEAECVITFNKVSKFGGRKYSLSSAIYEECYTTTFDICKNPEYSGWDGDYYITDSEYRQLVKWLNRRKFYKFRAYKLDYDGVEVTPFYYNASFNVAKLEIASKICGLRLTMETDAPYAYSDDVTETLTFSSANTSQTMEYESDELGEIYPTVTIKCSSAGDLEIINSEAETDTVMSNCSSGETLIFDGDILQVSSDDSSHDIANDFNYECPKITSTYGSYTNTFTVSLPCVMTVTYTPIVKNCL